jgi:PAS domain S-box-containing protein
MAKERRGKELPKGKPRGRGKQSSSTRSQRNIVHSRARSPGIQPVDCEERYRAVFDHSLQYICMHDFEGNILDINEAALKLLGYDREDIRRLNIASLLSEDQLTRASAALQELKDTGMMKQVNEWRLKRKDGSFVDMLLSGAPIYREGKLHAILGIGIDITERKRIEEALRQSEERYRTLAEQSLMGLVVVQDFHIVFANAAFAEISGYNIDELLSLPREKVQALIHPEDQALVWGRFRDLLAGKAVPPHYEYRGIRKDGTICWLEMLASQTEYGGKPAIRGAIINITERKQAEIKYKNIIETAIDGFWIMDLRGRFLDVNDSYCRMIGYTREELLKMGVPDVETVEKPRETAERIKRVIEQGYDRFETRHRRKDGKIIELEISATYSEARDGQFVVFIRDITERKRVEEALRLSEQNFHDSIEKSPLGIRIVTGDGRTLYVNKTLLDICGYGSLEELKAVPRNQLYTPESYAEHRERVNKRKRGEYVPSNYEISIVRKDGQIRRLSVSRGEVLWDGEKQSQVVYQDITEHKQAEEALRKSEEKYRRMFEGALDAIFIADAETGVMIDCNRAACELVGAERSELIGKHQRILHPPEEIEGEFSRTFREHLHAKEGKVVETQVITKKGEIKKVAIKANLLEFEGKKVLQGIFRDVTERKQAEEALEKSEERYRQLAENAGEAIFVVQDGVIKFINPKGAELSGYSIEELTSMPFVKFIHPNDIDMVIDRYARRVKGESVPQIYDFRIIRKDSNIRWGELNAVPISWEDRPAVLCFMNDITERKQVEEALRQSEERYRTMLEEMEEGYYEVDLAGTFTFVNDAMSRILGYSRDELIGMNYKAYTPQESMKTIFQEYNRVYRTGEPLKWYPMPEIRKDGTRILAEDSVFPLRNEKGEVIGFRGISRNVTERKKAEEALRQSEQRYRAILEEMADSYSEVDLSGNITFVNSVTCRHLGYSREELIGMSYKSFTAEDYIKPIFQIFNAIYRTGVPNKGFHWKVIRKDGSHWFIDASASPLRNDKGEIIGFSAVGRDITERMKMEEQLIITDRLASIGQLAAGIAHELNNPLTGVIGFSDLLLERDLPADVKEDLETVNREAKRAVNVIKGLLAFAREQRVEKSLLDINSIIQGVLQLRLYEQRVSNIEVSARFAPALPLVMGNGVQLQQVFINIIINAEQAMIEAHGRGKLTIVTERVGDVVRTSITDDGLGISPDNMRHLFTPFFTTREVGKGTGLGLSICHGIVTEHGGKVYAESELGEGATFVIELPISK